MTTEFNQNAILKEISTLKEELEDQVIILGHHYQQDDIIRFSDITGDSLLLAKEASKLDKPYIIFCGVHFMAETADMLSGHDQKVILPEMSAGCSMADMATRNDVDNCWNFLKQATNEKIVPITYINCDAQLKAFVGDHGGCICTSGNADNVIEWALNEGEKLLFFPDQHLGRNTSFKLGIPLEKMVIYNPHLPNGGLTKQEVQDATVILWYGCCSVHQVFTTNQIKEIHQATPETTIIVHPECCFEVVQAADFSGSTQAIIKAVEAAGPGASFAIGTEMNLVHRLKARHSDKTISLLSTEDCLCPTMNYIEPKSLLKTLQSIKDKKPINIIKVDEDITKSGILALNKMLEIS